MIAAIRGSRAVWSGMCWLLLAGCASAPPPGKYDDDPPAGDGPSAGGRDPDSGTGQAGGDAPPELPVRPAPEPEGPPAAGSEGSDEIFGAQVPRAESFWTEEGRLYHGTQEITLRGLNWFGLETSTLALHGPPQAGRSVDDFLTQITELGFNALRVPLSPESIAEGSATQPWAVRGELDTGREHLDELLAHAANRGIYLLLDVHTCAAAVGYRAGEPADPACAGYSEDDWIADLTRLAALAAAHAPWVVGIDLFNEPHRLTWQQWRALVERGGEAVLRENPGLLLFVEGVGGNGYSGGPGAFWGENLTLALADPIALPESRVVYSPHVYGPSVASQSYFSSPAFPDNMPDIWELHFGHLLDAGKTVVVGEFGGRYQDNDEVWQDAFVDYMRARGARSFFYWCLNPNSGDTGGLLLDDWRTVHEGKLSLLQRLME